MFIFSSFFVLFPKTFWRFLGDFHKNLQKIFVVVVAAVVVVAVVAVAVVAVAVVAVAVVAAVVAASAVPVVVVAVVAVVVAAVAAVVAVSAVPVFQTLFDIFCVYLLLCAVDCSMLFPKTFWSFWNLS